MPYELSRHIEDFTDPVQFERLCCDVLTFLGYQGIDPQGVGRRDGGKDAFLHHPTHGRVVFHFSLRADWRKKILEDIDRVSRSHLQCDQFIFVTNRRVSAAQKDSLKLVCSKQLGCDLEIFDQERLRAVLSANKHLCAQYFPDYYVASDVLGQVVDTLNMLVYKELIVPQPDSIGHLPRFIQATIARISALAMDGKTDEVLMKATEMVNTARSFASSIVHGLWSIGCVCFENGQLSAAETIWKQALSIDETHFGVNYNLGVLMEFNSKGRRYGHGFRVKEALDYYERALSGSSNPEQAADCLDNQGVVFLKTWQLDEAHKKFAAAQEQCPEHLSSRLNLATLADDWDTQAEIYTSLLNTPMEDKARINLVTNFIWRHKWRDALVCLRHIRNRNNYVECSLQLCEIALRRGRLKKARMYAERALLKDPDHPRVHFKLGEVFCAENDPKGAIQCYETVIDLDPQWVQPYIELADAYHQLGTRESLKRSIKVLEATLQIDPNLRNAHNNIGNAYTELDMYASARVEYQKEIQLHPDNKLAHFNLGYVAEFDHSGHRYSSSVNFIEAISHYREALRIDKEYFPALFNLGTDLILVGNHYEAIEVLEAALRISSENDSVMCNLAVAYGKLGRQAESLKLFRQALRLNPSNTYARLNLLQHLGLLSE